MRIRRISWSLLIVLPFCLKRPVVLPSARNCRIERRRKTIRCSASSYMNVRFNSTSSSMSNIPTLKMFAKVGTEAQPLSLRHNHHSLLILSIWLYRIAEDELPLFEPLYLNMNRISSTTNFKSVSGLIRRPRQLTAICSTNVVALYTASWKIHLRSKL